jgi:hypothetical protein
MVKDGVEMKEEEKSETLSLGNIGETLTIPKVTDNISYQLLRIKTLLKYENIEIEISAKNSIKLFDKVKVVGVDGEYEFVVFGIRTNFQTLKTVLSGVGNVIYK